MDHCADVAPSRSPAWHILEAVDGTVYLLPGEALIGYQVAPKDAKLLSAFVAGVDLVGEEAEAMTRLLTERTVVGGQPPPVVATRQVRAWALLH